MPSPARSQHKPHNVFAIIGFCVAAILIGSLALRLDGAARLVLWRTVLLGITASVIAVPLGALTFWVCRHRGWVSRLVWLVCLSLMLLPLFIHVSGWDAAFGKLGWLTSTRGQVLKPLLTGWWAAAWIHGIAATPQVALLFWAVDRYRRNVFEEQALLDASSFQVFWRITFVRFLPLAGIATLWIMISVAREITVTDLYQVGTLAEQVYLGYSLNNGSVAGAWTAEQLADAGDISTFLMMVTLGLFSLLACLFFFFMTRPEANAASSVSSKTTETSWPSRLVGVFLLLVLAVIPIGNVVIRACFLVKTVDGQPTQSYAVSQLWRSVSRAAVDYQDEFFWSSMIAAITTSVLVAFGLVVGEFARTSAVKRIGLAILLAFVCAIPGPLIGTWLAKIFSSIDHAFLNWLVDYTVFGPVLANLFFCAPVGMLLLWFLMFKVPIDSMESAALEGASRWQRFFKISVAGNLGAIAGCWLILFAYSFGELSASQMVRPAGLDTVSRKMLGDLHAGVNELTAGITIVMSAGVVGVSLLGWGFIWLNRGRGVRK